MAGARPAVTFVANAYYVALLYGRGARPEFVAISAIPLLVAAGVRIARATRLEPAPCALFVGAAVIWSGSHNITLLWGAIAIFATIPALRLVIGRRLVPNRRRLAALLWLLALAVAVNAWFLLPNVLYASQTQLATRSVFDWSSAGDVNAPLAISTRCATSRRRPTRTRSTWGCRCGCSRGPTPICSPRVWGWSPCSRCRTSRGGAAGAEAVRDQPRCRPRARRDRRTAAPRPHRGRLHDRPSAGGRGQRPRSRSRSERPRARRGPARS